MNREFVIVFAAFVGALAAVVVFLLLSATGFAAVRLLTGTWPLTGDSLSTLSYAVVETAVIVAMIKVFLKRAAQNKKS